jgi:hypothetical protein
MHSKNLDFAIPERGIRVDVEQGYHLAQGHALASSRLGMIWAASLECALDDPGWSGHPYSIGQ